MTALKDAAKSAELTCSSQKHGISGANTPLSVPAGHKLAPRSPPSISTPFVRSLVI
jgi:hypothetical protein